MTDILASIVMYDGRKAKSWSWQVQGNIDEEKSVDHGFEEQDLWLFTAISLRSALYVIVHTTVTTIPTYHTYFLFREGRMMSQTTLGLAGSSLWSEKVYKTEYCAFPIGTDPDHRSGTNKPRAALLLCEFRVAQEELLIAT